ncbi:hypothetical protein A9Q98_00040 [Thalassotalea sp. 42_200_T64]|nr:hypothetical protein A9Q98_00040 [Thalassotalea sp. 42_200_T64]
MQIIQAVKTDKKTIKRFYKSNHYSARFIGDDVCYFIQNDNTAEQELIACVIISYQQSTPFLHALVVNKDYRSKGLATSLVSHCQQQFQQITCFVELPLTKWYLQQGFELTYKQQLATKLASRLLAYQQKSPFLQSLIWQK